MSILVVSPHLDDAVFSVGEWIYTHEDVDILTVFAGHPEEDREEIVARRFEDVEACRRIGASWRHLNFLEEKYGGTPVQDLVDGLSRYVEAADMVLVPVGIHHPDHVRVAEAVDILLALDRSDTQWGIYEELPYRVMYPEIVPVALEPWRRLCRGRLRLDGCGGKYEEKLNAVYAYASQIGEDVYRSVFVPERIWWVE